MDVSVILDPLNDAQREGVCAPLQNALILAGAGSGKTRVLVHRIAWLLQAEGQSPYSILAVTFTNKAAGEMRGRIEHLLGMPAGGMWVGTFHGIAHRLLRAHWKEAELPQTFQIIDSDDQQRALKRIIRDMGIDENQFPPKEAQWFINARKDEGLRAEHLSHDGDYHLRQMIEIYHSYEALCQRSGLVDFAELLLRAHELWLKRPDVLQSYRERFKHILVDEFQDTNTIQYAWLRLLAGETGKLFAVGDDDQSIYGWRGARVENLHQFSKDYADVLTCRLEQNYRSTGTILKAANALIDHNTDRLGKNLWTEGKDGELIQVYSAFNELDEANYIVERIAHWVDHGGLRSECALLYRSNAQSRVLEEALLQRNMPYRIYGGLRFFERQEIKDALAYLRMSSNRHDDAAFERIINVPTRGIGARTVATMREAAREHSISLWQALYYIIEHQLLPNRALSSLQAFANMIDELAISLDGLELNEKVEQTVQHSGLIEHYKKEKGERGHARIENLEELVSAGRNFMDADNIDEELDPLSAFLAHASLEAGERQAGESEDSVQLMTMHSAKGLEFEQVFICGLEEGLFPHKFSMDDPNRLEEERRLCYVAMTRARQLLTLSFAERRRLYGEDSYPRPSRFLAEVPEQYCDWVRMQGHVSGDNSIDSDFSDNPFATDKSAPLQLGQAVMHDKFGEGVVLNYEGEGRHARVQVNFVNEGSKWLVLEYANLHY